jgi:hypothetical protein
MRSGDRPGLQNRRAASYGVAGGFDPHSLPPVFNNVEAVKSLEMGERKTVLKQETAA